MKKIKLIFAILSVVVLMPSCTDDGGKSKVDFEIGATPNILKAAGTDPSINLLSVANGVKINLGVTVTVGQGDVVSIDLVGFYKKTTTYEKAYLLKGITTFPTTFKFDQFTIMNAFTTVNAPSDFTLNSSLIVTAEMTLKDGRIIKMYKDDGTPNFGADISNSSLFKVQQTYLMSCPLTDASNFNGDYKVTKDDWADYAVGDIVPVVYDPANGTLTFRILNVNNPYILNAATSYMICVIDPATSKVKVTANEVFNYNPGYGPTTGTGTVGSCSGAINLTLAFGPYGGYNFNLVKK
jgi:hypothetical protein